MSRPIHCILLIDDDPDDNLIHQLVAEESGLCDEVRVAENGLEALHYLTNTDQPDYVRPDVIFLDINMPVMNGFEFLERYGKLPDDQKGRVLALMLTNLPNSPDRKREGVFAEVSRYHTKPLTVAMLQDIVDQYFS